MTKHQRPVRFVVVTGLSGAGKSAAIRALEDLGYLCVDNLPVVLIPILADLAVGKNTPYDAVAAVIDVRDHSFFDQFGRVFDALRKRSELHTWLIFLEASDAALVRRFSETRRPHPLAQAGSVIEGILAERQHMSKVKHIADRVLDTSDFTVHELRDAFGELFEGTDGNRRLTVTLLSFGYKYGLPPELDLCFDCRLLPNPRYVNELEKLTGQHKLVRDYVLESDGTRSFIDLTLNWLRFSIPRYSKEGKSYLTIGIGCTGGHHRSVAVAEHLKEQLTGIEHIFWRVKHRDVVRDDV
jgi:UPF0042 nucleotide-binding protein